MLFMCLVFHSVIFTFKGKNSVLVEYLPQTISVSYTFVPSEWLYTNKIQSTMITVIANI